MFARHPAIFTLLTLLLGLALLAGCASNTASRQSAVSQAELLRASQADLEAYQKFLEQHPGTQPGGYGQQGQDQLDAKAYDLKQTKELLLAGASYLNSRGNWTDEVKGKQIYDALQIMSAETVARALIELVAENSPNRLQILFLGVKLGLRGSQEGLIKLLMAFGDKQMAEDCLNSGSPELRQGGIRWAKAHGLTVRQHSRGSHRVKWGQF
ncbi:MAG: hypothetical protein AB1814_17845 [Thermodesulfobacteriota bacterium]